MNNLVHALETMEVSEVERVFVLPDGIVSHDTPGSQEYVTWRMSSGLPNGRLEMVFAGTPDNLPGLTRRLQNSFAKIADLIKRGAGLKEACRASGEWSGYWPRVVRRSRVNA